MPVTFDNSTYVRAYDLLGAKVGYRRMVTRHWRLETFAGGDNLLDNTFDSFLFVGPNIQGLASRLRQVILEFGSGPDLATTTSAVPRFER